MSTSVSSTGLTSPSGHPFRMPAVNSRAKTTQLLENLVASDREVLGTDRSPSLGESSDDVSSASGTEEDPIMLPEESSAGSQSQPRSSSDSAASFASSGSSKAMLAPAKPTRSDFPILKASCLVLMMRTATQATAIPVSAGMLDPVLFSLLKGRTFRIPRRLCHLGSLKRSRRKDLASSVTLLGVLRPRVRRHRSNGGEASSLLPVGCLSSEASSRTSFDFS
ncbi:hypothetical protein F443_05666 [Phytophthora nicotianae P1569]|uniref:Uncharacterized protein n=2 Tax=Phytophthora nicotianae TaxID=4792 RepID=V9FJ80_PHYNI|nr:hypothetical protein F443_05666 [Phytophthora nicotianae P1569]